MNESIRTLENAIREAKNAIVNAMMKVVMEHGYDFHDSYDYYYNDFGIVEEEYEENTKILKIVDMFNNGGAVSHMHICITKRYQQTTKKV